jgi:hypothetical protein
VDFREKTELPASRIIDVQFKDFIADPVLVVERIYERFDLELRPEVKTRMNEYLRQNPSDRDGAHAHRLEDTGLDVEEERAKVARYQNYFDVPVETVGS